MRYYPFGVGADISAVLTSSLALRTVTASYSDIVFTASLAISGSPGTSGSNGVCIYTTGPQGYQGVQGLTGPPGVVSNEFPYP
jgi:hypothetical protein